MPFLEYQDNDVPVFIVLTPGLVVGRGEGVGLQLSDRSCSREHFQVERRQGQWAIVDLGSANGTTVNGQLISRVSVNDGDVVRCGNTNLVYRRTRPLLGGADEEVESSTVPEVAQRSGRSSSPWTFLLILIVGLSGFGYWFLSGLPAPKAKSQTGPDAAAEDVPNTKNPPVVVTEALTDDDRAELEARRVFRADVESTREGALASADRGDWAEAMDLVDALLLRAVETGQRSRSVKARRLRVNILKRLHGDWDATVRPYRDILVSGEIDSARELLAQLGSRFESTPVAGRIDSERALLELKVFLMSGAPTPVVSAPTSSSPSTAATTSEPTEPKPDALWLIATDAASRADWATAATFARRALSADDAPVGLKSRARLYEAHVHLREAVLLAFVPGAKGFSRFSMGRISVLPIGADEIGIELQVGKKGKTRWKWNDLKPEHLIRLYRSIARTGPLRVDTAVVMAANGQQDQATAMMIRAVRDSEVKYDADQIVAAWRGIPVPDGGFIVDSKRFLTPAEKEFEDLARRATRLARGIKRARISKYRELVSELRSMGRPARPALNEALTQRVAALFEATRKVGALGKISATRGALSARLKLLRTEALGLIFDSKRYPYPYAPDQEKVQAEVDGLTGKVKALYFHPGRYLFEQDRALNAHIEFWAEAADDLAQLSRKSSDTSAMFEMIDVLVDLPKHGDSAKHVQKNAEIMQYNLDIKTTASTEEREVVRLSNVYRMTMGLRAVKIAEPLMLAARGHSTEMQKLKYFSHTSPIKGRARPSDRARLAGWGGGVSENIARGSSSAQGAVNGWIHSSGHHRNILGRGWVHLGVGLSPQNWYWTQNFGR